MCIKYSKDADRREIVDEIMEVSKSRSGDETDEETMSGALYQMMKDRYGNYVIQQCIEASSGKQRDNLVARI